MNRRLAAAVIASFQEGEADRVRRSFAPFDEREWMRSRDWLHTSGLALYFMGRTKILGIEKALPAQILDGLQGNLAENRIRVASLFDEFVAINMEFQRARLSYANLKGFTLIPRACPDPAYRYQHDLDFLVSQRDAERCRQALERHGYRLSAVFGDTWEFRAGAAEVATLSDLYKVRSQRSVEIHLVADHDLNEQRSQIHGDRLARLQLQIWNGFEFPALSECDKFLGQALHLFKHFQTEWTRTAWMLEYATALRSHIDDASFWREAVAAIQSAPETAVGIGVATLVACRTFDVVPPAEFTACTIDLIPKQVRLWINLYENELVYVEHPGTKLYLLLRDVLNQDNPEWQNQRHKKLFPSRLPPSINVASPSDDFRLQAKTTWAQVRFVWQRLRFHVTAGLKYKLEAARWKRLVADLRV